MIRTVISLDLEDKQWLDAVARSEDATMTEVVRRAVRHYRSSMVKKNSSSLSSLLNKTSGVWRKSDGLVYQQKIRAEWK